MKPEDAGEFWSSFLRDLSSERDTPCSVSGNSNVRSNSLEAILNLVDGQRLIIALTSIGGRTSPCDAPTYMWARSKYGILVVWARDDRSFKYRKVYIDPNKIVSVEHCPIRRRNDESSL